MPRAIIELTSRQVEEIIRQSQGGDPIVSPGLPEAPPPDYIPPPVTADKTYAFETLWQLPILTHSKAYHAVIPDLSQSGTWACRLIRASTYEQVGETKFTDQASLRINTLAVEKARWPDGPGYADINAKLDALTVPDSSLIAIPERIRYGRLYDQAYVAGDYILELIDERGQVVNITWTQGAVLPESMVFYTAQAGAQRWFYCTYKL